MALCVMYFIKHLLISRVLCSIDISIDFPQKPEEESIVFYNCESIQSILTTEASIKQYSAYLQSNALLY